MLKKKNNSKIYSFAINPKYDDFVYIFQLCRHQYFHLISLPHRNYHGHPSLLFLHTNPGFLFILSVFAHILWNDNYYLK